jgi:hypothetical protein
MGEIPVEWKMGVVIPVHKEGENKNEKLERN